MINKISIKEFVQVLLLTFLVIQVSSFLLTAILGFPLLKLGYAFLLFATITFLITIWTLGLNLNNLNNKTMIFMLVVLASVIALFVLMPKYIPDIFSVTGLDYAKELNSVINLGG